MRSQIGQCNCCERRNSLCTMHGALWLQVIMFKISQFKTIAMRECKSIEHLKIVDIVHLKTSTSKCEKARQTTTITDIL